MTSDERSDPAPPPSETQPTLAAWLLALGIAEEDGDSERAAEARRELERLGVLVRFRGRNRRRPLRGDR
jgi:hypothetical protein